MTLTTKLLLATVATIPSAGYGGYCVYDSYYPTFHSRLIGKGWAFSPIDLNRNIGENWICSKHIFEDIKSPASNNDSSQEGGKIPSATSNTKNSRGDYLGCLVANLGQTEGSSKFLKWELALKRGNKGFIYIGELSIGTNSNKEISSQFSSNVVFEVIREEEVWDIKGGLIWNDYSTFKGKLNISLSNNNSWVSQGNACDIDNEKCSWEFKRYVGLWEQGGSEQAIDAIKIELEEKTKKKVHDVWSKRNFSFEKSTITVSSVYDGKTNKWKGIREDVKNAKDYLKAIYSPWANKKGTWMKAEDVCYESSNRNLKEEDKEGQRLLKFCYKKETISDT